MPGRGGSGGSSAATHDKMLTVRITLHLLLFLVRPVAHLCSHFGQQALLSALEKLQVLFTNAQKPPRGNDERAPLAVILRRLLSFH